MTKDYHSAEDDFMFDDEDEVDSYILSDDEPADPSFSAGSFVSKSFKPLLTLCIVAAVSGGTYYAYKTIGFPLQFSNFTNKGTYSAVEPRGFGGDDGRSTSLDTESEIKKVAAISTPALDREIVSERSPSLTPFPGSDTALVDASTLGSLDIASAEVHNNSIEKDPQPDVGSVTSNASPVRVSEEEQVVAESVEIQNATQEAAQEVSVRDVLEPPLEDLEENIVENIVADAEEQEVVMAVPDSISADIENIDAPSIAEEINADVKLGSLGADTSDLPVDITTIEPVAPGDSVLNSSNALGAPDLISPDLISKDDLPVSAQYALNKKPDPALLSVPVSVSSEKQAVSEIAGTWQINGAQPGKAVLKNLQTGELISIEVGNIVRGLGAIRSIGRVNGRWVVQGSQASLKR